MSEFSGFPTQTFDYLRDLFEHNDREWFTANRARYDEFYLAPALAFIEALGPRLAAEVPGDVRFEARVNGSLFRINRDVRFSADKRPYKDHLDMRFWLGERRGFETPGYFMRLQAHEWAIAGGMIHLDKDGLERYRAAVVDERLGKALEAAVKRLDGSGMELGGMARKNVPRGFDASHPRAAYEGLFAIHSEPVPAVAHTPEFVDVCLDHFKAASPVTEWLMEALRPGRR